jgi:outer membrane protein OmpA-like peptidoglycan-associated protein
MIILRVIILSFALAVPTSLAVGWTSSAQSRLEAAQVTEDEQPDVAVASSANEQYCTGNLKKVLRRVLQSCGLLESGSVRGCQPADAKTVATMSGDDFNALFRPMKSRGGIVQFEKEESELDADAIQLVDQVFADQRGASYFFVVSRSSPEGSTEFNRELSKARAESVMSHLRQRFQDPDLEKEVGLLWLGEEFAQLDEEFCQWNRSKPGKCEPEDLNRSAFIAWIDCTL